MSLGGLIGAWIDLYVKYEHQKSKKEQEINDEVEKNRETIYFNEITRLENESKLQDKILKDIEKQMLIYYNEMLEENDWQRYIKCLPLPDINHINALNTYKTSWLT